jgi:hypothetical protein
MTERKHHPACDSQLGPDFKVEPGSVTMVLGMCWDFACWEEFSGNVEVER